MGAGRSHPRWARYSDEHLLELRIADLRVDWRGTWVEEQVERLQEELLARDLRLRPHFWVSDEWFSPDGVPGIAIPFFVLHPRLVRLERKQMLEVDGGNPTSCMRVLRHEVGHALQHGFRLARRRRWQELFGPATTPYPDYYRPNPSSRRYVVHLPYWYGQSHPTEDFAETFAVWLTPGSGWRRRYRGWRALEKLEYVNDLMTELAGHRPPLRSRARVDPAERNTQTLRAYYEAKRKRYASSSTTPIYDEDLVRLFRGTGARGEETAAAFLRRSRAELRRRVAGATGRHELALDTVLGDMIERCRELRLRARGDRRRLVGDFAILLAARSTEYVFRGREWHAL